jgi:solute carrier family 25 carnitine/acylcarnitine transporter 20/29
MDWKDVVAGGVGGGLSVLCAHPFDTIKVRLQTTNNYSGMRDCFMKMVRKEGARSG